MNRLFGSLLVQFREFYKTLTPVRKMALLGASIIVMVTAGVMVVMLTGQSYAPLFKDIAPDQLPILVSSLRQKNISFKLSEDSSAIFVPTELLHSTQMAIMAESGSEQMGSIGLELFEKQDFGTTSYAQRINYQRALQGELVRAINTLSAVKQSKVLLALPPKKTFLEEGAIPTASVVIDLHPGKRLTEDQVKGVTFLVSSAVENLEPDNVSVVDSRGKVLTRQYDSQMGATSELLDMKKKVEHQLEQRIEAILSKVVGAGNVIAKVEASLNSKKVDMVEEQYDQERAAIRSVQKEEEALDGARTSPSGVPGARANLPGAGGNGQVGFKQDVKREISTTNYEVPKTIRTVKEQAGNLERLSVAVLVDHASIMEKGENGKITEKNRERSAEELRKYENIIKSAIGYSESRGDTVKIENIRFENEDFSESERLLSTLERKKLLYSLFRWAALACVIGIFFFLFIRPFMRWVTDSFQDSVEDMLPKTIEELEDLQSADSVLPGMQGALPTLQDSLDPDKAESELLRERIMVIMEQDEEKTTNAFKLWLNKRELS